MIQINFSLLVQFFLKSFKELKLISFKLNIKFFLNAHIFLQIPSAIYTMIKLFSCFLMVIMRVSFHYNNQKAL